MANENNASRAHIVEWLTIVSLILGCFYFNHNTMKEIKSEISTEFERMDQQLARMDQRMLQQEARTDQLYTMFIDLVKEGKK